MKATKKQLAPVSERILETACNLFYVQGYRATGINQVIAESGVAKASFYDHFPSKDDLLMAYVEEMARREITDLREQVLAFPAARERFFAPLNILVPWFKDSGYRGCPFQNAVAEIPPGEKCVHGAIARYREEERVLFRELTTAFVAGERALRNADTDLLADMYMLLFDGAIALAAAVRAPWPVERAREALEAHLKLVSGKRR